MKKIITISLIIFICIYIVFAFITINMNYEGIYQKFNDKIVEAGYEIKAGSIEVVHFPVPHVVLGNVSVPNILSAKNLNIDFSLLSILKFKPVIKTISASDVSIIMSGGRSNFAKHGASMLEMINLVSKLPELKMYNVSVIDKNSNLTDGARSILINPESGFNQVIINWDDRTNTRVTYGVGKESINVKITATAQFYQFEIDETYKDNILKSGNVKYNIPNLKQYVANRYQDLDLLVTKIQSQEPVDISCHVESVDNKIKISDLNIKSNSVIAAGSAELDKDDFPSKLDLDIDLLNLNTLLAAPNIDFVKESRSKEKIKLSELKSAINIKSKKVILVDEELSDVVINAVSDGTEFKVNNFTGKMDDGKFSVSGIITQNQYRSLFDGKFSLVHKDANLILSKLGFVDLSTKTPANLILSSAIKATPIDYQFNKLFMQVGSFNIDGSMTVKFIGDTPRINLAVGVSSLDFSKTDYPVISKTLSYFYSLAEDMSSKEYLKKYIPIRSIPYLGNFDLLFKDVKILGHMVDKFHIVTDVSKGTIDLHSLYYQEGPNYFTGTGYLSSNGIKPEISVKIEDAEFFTNDINLNSILSSMKKLREGYDLTKVNINTDVKILHLEQGENKFKDIILSGKNEGVLWNIKSLGFINNQSTFMSSGSIRMDPMTLNLSYAYNNFDLGVLGKEVSLNVFGIDDGWASSNGMISTNGETKEQLLYNLYTKSNFVAKDVKLNNFGIDKFVGSIVNAEYPEANLEKDADYFMGNGNSVMDNISGGLELDHGILKFTEIAFNTKFVSGSAGLNYNIYKSDLALASKVVFLPPVPPYKTSRPVAIPFNLKGTLSSLRKDINLDEVKLYLKSKLDNANKNFYNSQR